MEGAVTRSAASGEPIFDVALHLFCVHKSLEAAHAIEDFMRFGIAACHCAREARNRRPAAPGRVQQVHHASVCYFNSFADLLPLAPVALDVYVILISRKEGGICLACTCK
eukprot:5583589-Prymnesium_polylepis.1